MGRTDGILGAIGERYSALAETTCCLSCGRAADMSAAALGEVCVDLGSGQGADVLKLAAIVGSEGFVYGVDTSEGMLRRAKRTAEKMGVKNVAFVRSELQEIGLEDGIADLVISNCTINHAPDKSKVWSEVFRVLKPGGRFVVSDIYAMAEVPEEYRTDPRLVAECWAGAVTRDVYLETLARAGFTKIAILEESAPYEKGEVHVASLTIAGKRPGACCCGQ